MGGRVGGCVCVRALEGRLQVWGWAYVLCDFHQNTQVTPLPGRMTSWVCIYSKWRAKFVKGKYNWLCSSTALVKGGQTVRQKGFREWAPARGVYCTISSLPLACPNGDCAPAGVLVVSSTHEVIIIPFPPISQIHSTNNYTMAHPPYHPPTSAHQQPTVGAKFHVTHRLDRAQHTFAIHWQHEHRLKEVMWVIMSLVPSPTQPSSHPIPHCFFHLQVGRGWSGSASTKIFRN